MMSDEIDLFDFIDDVLENVDKLERAAKKVSKLFAKKVDPPIEHEVYTEEPLYKEKMKTVGDIQNTDKRKSPPKSEAIDMELDSKGSYVVKRPKLEQK